MKKRSLRSTVLDFDIGGMGEARLKGVRFADYRICETDDDFQLIPDFLHPDQITAIEPYYKVTGQELLLRILNLYKSWIPRILKMLQLPYREWSLKNIHPYTTPEFFACGDLSWEEHWINLWGSGIGSFSVRDFIYECKKFHETASAVLTLTLIQTGREKEADAFITHISMTEVLTCTRNICTMSIIQKNFWPGRQLCHDSSCQHEDRI